jgi:hypothetical protein
MLNKINEELKWYFIAHETDEHIVDEDQIRRKRDGYCVINDRTGVIEYTTIVLPQAIFQAQHLDAMLESILNPKEMPEVQMPTAEDVVVN